MIVKVMKTNPNARIPEKTYDSDFCFDVWAVGEEEIAPNVWKYDIGLAFEIVRPYPTNLKLSIDIRSRSSIWKTGMVLSNGVGTVDEDYRNGISAVFYHVMPNMPRYKIGDKIGQIKIGCCSDIRFEEVKELSITERGQKGYGSTGNK